MAQQPARLARVKAPLPDNSELIRKHSLTLIGRVTNKSTQKVWSLIPFFTEHWKTEFKPVGSDLGNGLFQFQFERESDLLSVLEQRPYHYARWLIILQRWEPTISPTFPSLIPFWIKIQGLPVHLWTEPIAESLGRDIGIYEKTEITSLTIRMRVHVNGLLPLITKSVVEFPNGDEVATTLVYERLDKHCTKCLRLDHELKECLVARAEAKEAKAKLDEANQPAESLRGFSTTSIKSKQNERLDDYRGQTNFQFSAASREQTREGRYHKERREPPHQRTYKPMSTSWQEKSSSRRMHQSQERSRYEQEKATRSHRGNSIFRHPPAPPSRSYYREVHSDGNEAKDMGSSASKGQLEKINEGNPLHPIMSESTPRSTRNSEREDVRDLRLQITISPSQLGGAVRVDETPKQVAQTTPPERLSASQRLGPSIPPASNSQERVSARLRLGEKSTSPTEVPRLHASLRLGEAPKSPSSKNKLPATQRLGPTQPVEATEGAPEAKIKRKPGRPPGSRKVQESPTLTKGGTSKRRKVTSSKPPPCRRKIHSEDSRKGTKKAKDGASRPATSTGTHSSENLPISRMIPKTTRRKTGFHIPSDPVP